MTRQITLCADDYGLHPAINHGILILAKQRRLSAVSCMSQSTLWPEAAHQLAPYRRQLSVGLHFNLTEGLAATDIPLSKLVLSALTGRLDTQQLTRLLQQQLDVFEAHWQAPPDHVDGHQHVHALPNIRATVMATLKARYGAKLPALRDPGKLMSVTDAPLKSWLLRLLCRHFGATANAHGFSCNNAFAGVYSLADDVDYARLFNRWAHDLPHGGLLMCHPAKGYDMDFSCAHLAARNHEFDYLTGPRLTYLLQRLDLQLEPASA